MEKPKHKVVSLFPYQIKDVKNFHFRNHPKQAHPKSPSFKNYWSRFEKYVLEGRWINDNGTWVFMMPKLFFYVNYAKIVDKERDERFPDLRDNEWILFTYFLCVEGFSGFEKDENYTCHDYIRRHEKSQKKDIPKKDQEPLNAIEYNSIPDSAKKPDGTYKKYIDPWYYLTRHYLIDEPAEKPLGRVLYENPKYNACILSARGVGKASDFNELVRIKNGWAKIGDLKIGDFVYGGDGELTEIKAVHDHKSLQFYKLIFRDGRDIEVCEDHLWKVWDSYSTRDNGKRGDWVVKDTKSMFETYRNRRIDSKYKNKHGEIKYIEEYRYAIPLSESLKDEDSADLPIDPYVLGVLLGDGCITGKTNPTVASADDEVLEEVIKRLPKGYSLNIRKVRNHKEGGIVCNGDNCSFNTLIDLLGLLGKRSDTKFIPKQYLYGSESQKLELLKGLMDADGWSNERGIIEYYTVSDQLADDFVNLVRSLGIGCSRSVKKTTYKLHGIKKRGKDCHRIRLTTDKPVFKLERKLEYLNHKKGKSGQSRYHKTFIVNIEKTTIKSGRCITIDNEDRTYITKDYIRTHNSFTTFVGDFLHEWITSGVKLHKNKHKVNKRLLFGMGSAKAPQLDRSLDNVSSVYDKMPGQYEYGTFMADGRPKPNYMGPFYKRVQGGWAVGEKIQHTVKKKNRTNYIKGSRLQMVALTKDQVTIGAGDRFRRIYVEEFGFLENAIDVHGANKDSLKSEGERVGSAFYLGTGGDMTKIKQPKKMFEHPRGYDIFGIPNYWAREDKKIGLFIPVMYAMKKYKDENGNTNIEMAYEAAMAERELNKDMLDSISYELEIMFNPIEPKEMLRPSNSGLLPKQEAAEQLSKIDTYDIFRKRAQIGRLKYNPLEPRGVEWEKDMYGTLRPILEWGGHDDDRADQVGKDGAIIIYEQPPDYIPEGLYWVLYDPAKQSGDAESYHSILVYKSFYTGREKTMYDTIVAELLCRKERLEDNYNEVIKFAKYFNARIFPEINVAGFVEWCKTNDYSHLLEGDAYFLEKEIEPNSKRSYYKVGFQMTNQRKKGWCLRTLRDWLTEVKHIDPVTGVPELRTMDWILSPRILNEIISYSDDKDENFDHISSLLGLMLLIGKLKDSPPADLDEEPEEVLASELVDFYNRDRQEAEYRPPQRCAFLEY